MTVISTMRSLNDARGAVRMEDLYATGIEDLWEACTRPERLARWIATVTGDLHVGGMAHVVFTSTWAGPIRIESCDPPHHLLITGEPGTDDESQTEAWLTAEGSHTRLVVEERGLPLDQLHFHGAGWQGHLEDLERSLAGNGPVHPEGWSETTPAPAWRARLTELTPAYEARLSDV